MDILSWSGIKAERVSDQVTRQVFWGEHIMVVRWDLAADADVPVHEHVSEQVTIVEKGSATLTLPDGEQHTLREGDMVVIPPSRPHGVKVGPDGCTALDLFSPIREDLIDRRPSDAAQSGAAGGPEGMTEEQEEQAYRELLGFLHATGIKADLEEITKLPLLLVARFTYERECLSMGQLRKILGLDKAQAKELLRQWKHGDDHSEASLRRKWERLVILPGDQPPRRRS
ncbi:MAG: cupin domain-containing protein [Deltaproteobacteria bacterium]